jgi:cytochrome c
MKNSGIVWDETTLDTYLKKPRSFMKGTRMAFAGLKKDKDRENIIAYLKEATKRKK